MRRSESSASFAAFFASASRTRFFESASSPRLSSSRARAQARAVSVYSRCALRRASRADAAFFFGALRKIFPGKFLKTGGDGGVFRFEGFEFCAGSFAVAVLFDERFRFPGRGERARKQRLFCAFARPKERFFALDELFLRRAESGFRSAQLPPRPFAGGKHLGADALFFVDRLQKSGIVLLPLFLGSKGGKLFFEANARLLQMRKPFEMGAVQPALLFELQKFCREALALLFAGGERFAKIVKIGAFLESAVYFSMRGSSSSASG